jgi:hypothetical protein
METAQTTRIEIPVKPDEAAKTIKKAKALAKRAAEKGLSGGWSVVETKTVAKWNDQTGVNEYFDVIVLEGEPFAYEGWKFVAAVEWLEGKPFVSVMPGYEADAIDRDALVEGHCDHCQKNRKRSKVYIVESADGRQQVGSACVKDFIGHDLGAVLTPPDDGADDDMDGFGAYVKNESKTVEVLAAALRISKVKGYLSKAKAASVEGTPSVSTAALVSDYLYGHGPHSDDFRKEIGPVADADMVEAGALLKWVAEEFTGHNDYAKNLRVAAGLEFTGQKTLGTLVSAIGAKGFSDERKAAKAASAMVEEQFAATGEKVEVEVSVEAVRFYDGMYGRVAFVSMLTDTHRFKWKATGAKVPEQGSKVKISGTVKGTDEFNGAIFTLLTRCKFEEVA